MSMSGDTTSGGVSTVISAPEDFGSRFKLSDIIQTKAGLCALTFIVTLLISISLEPPFLLVNSDDPFKEPRFSYSRAVSISALAAYAVIKLPSVVREQAAHRSS